MTDKKIFSEQVLSDIKAGDPAEVIAISQAPMNEPGTLTLRRPERSELKIPGTGSKDKTVNIQVRKTRTFVKQEDKQSTLPKVALPDANQEEGTIPTAPKTALMDQLTADTDEPSIPLASPVTDKRTHNTEVAVDNEPAVQKSSEPAASSLPKPRDKLMPRYSQLASLNPFKLYAPGTNNRSALLAFRPRIPYDFHSAYKFIKAQYKPGMSQQPDTDPSIEAEIDEKWLRNRAKTLTALKAPQMKEVIRLVCRSNIGPNVAVYATDLAGAAERVAICFHERGLHTLQKGKPLTTVTAQFHIDVCTIWPLEQYGCLYADNLIIVPAMIARSNNKTLPAEETSNRYEHLRTTGQPARIQRSEYFLQRMIKAHGAYDTYIFIENALQHLSFTKPEDREAPVVSLPVFGLLMRECERLSRFSYLIPGLMALNMLYSRQTGILEVSALLCLNALTLGDPEEMMHGMLHMAYYRPSKTGSQPEPVEIKPMVTEYINSWLYAVYGEDILVAAEAFEKGLYRSMFTQPPLALHW